MPYYQVVLRGIVVLAVLPIAILLLVILAVLLLGAIGWIPLIGGALLGYWSYDLVVVAVLWGFCAYLRWATIYGVVSGAWVEGR